MRNIDICFLCRKIEDTLAQYNLALRPFHLAINLDSLHSNAEQRGCYDALIVVCDHALPAKGVNYRLPKSGHAKDVDESPAKIPKEEVNVCFGLIRDCQRCEKHKYIAKAKRVEMIAK